jgi:acyl-CoA thioester hydrolase
MADALQTKTFEHPVRVYYEDTDTGGIVYYANYLKFAERARTEMLRSLGIENSTLLNEQRVAFAVKECSADYIKPAVLDDALNVVTTVENVGGASMRLIQDIFRGQERLVAITVRLACMNIDTGQPCRLPHEVRTVMGQLNNENK